MVTLVGDVHFWSLRDDVIVKDADIGAYRYQEKGNVSKERVYYGLRKKYVESRGGVVVIKNSRPHKLRDSLKELEEYLSKEKTILEGWKNATTYQILFLSGLISLITVQTHSGDINQIVFDKFLQGKLLSENVADVCCSSNYLIFSYNDSRITLVHITKPLTMLDSKMPCRVSSQEPKVSTCEGIGPVGRRFERKLSINLTEEKMLVWWATGEDEVYPWSPLNKDQDRANLLVYNINGSSLELLCYCRTEMSPLSICFSRNSENVILTVEQGFDKGGGVTVLSCVYEVERGTLRRVSVTSIPLDAPLTAHSHNPAETRLLLACNNGVLALHCESRGMTHVTKAGLIPSCITWMNSGTLLFVANERGQMQCFDMALSLVRMQLLLEDLNPQRILDFSDFFCHNQLLLNLKWAPLPPGTTRIPPLLLHFTNGPLACLLIECGQLVSHASSKNVNNFSITPNMMVCQYVKHRQFDEAINMLVSLSWEMEGKVALQCLCTVVSALLKLPLNLQRETQIEAALSSFLVPAVPLSPSVEEEFGPAVRAITRRFFFKVLRKGHLEKAYRLALDLNDHDCFLNVHHVARCYGNKQLASLSMQSARELNSDSCWSGSCSSFLGSDSGDSDSCSQSCSESCSTCLSDSEDQPQKEVLSDIKEEISVPHHSSHSDDTSFNNHEPQNNLYQTSSGEGSGLISNPAAVQSCQDGTITINIRQGHLPTSSLLPDSTIKLPNTRISNFAPYIKSNGNIPSRIYHHPTVLTNPSGRLKPVKEVSEVSYSSDSAEELTSEKSLPLFIDQKELQRQYERAVFQEVTTEEEDGSTVKVVHFGVV